MPPAQRVWKIIIPAALPRIFVAFRLSAGIALIVAVTVEIAINPLGLGAGIMLAQQALRPDLMLAYLVWIGVIGYALNVLLIVAQSRLFGRAALSGDSQMNRSVILWRVASFAVAAGFVALWQLIANLKLVSPVFLPGPDRAWAALVRGFSIGRPLEQARGHARTHGLWLARRLDRRHRDRRDHRIVAHDADLCRALAGVFAAAAGLGDHSGCDRHARTDAGDGAVRDRLRRDLADHAGDHPWLCGGRAAALRGRALAADVAARGDLQRSRCPPPAPTFSPACASA